MMQNHNFFGIILLSVIFSSCTLGPKNGEVIFLHSGTSDMQVWIRGNRESTIAILIMPGGPCGSGNLYPSMRAFRLLEEKYTVIYWDQRGSGSSQGIVDKSELNVEQFVKDTNDLIDVLNNQYSFNSIYLLGTSFGGAIGTAFLLDPLHQTKIKGWIEVDGAHNVVDSNILSRQKLIDFITNLHNSTTDLKTRDHIEKVLQWYELTPQILNMEDMIRHQKYVIEFNFDGLGNSFETPDSVNLLFNSPNNYLSYYMNGLHNKYFDISYINYSDQLSTIICPSLIIWGELDGLLPVEMAYDAYNHLGTSETEKHLVILSGAGHACTLYKPDDFANAVSGFIDTYQ